MMPVIALIPNKQRIFNDQPETELPVIRVFGYESIVDPNPEGFMVQTLAYGVSCLLDTDLKTLKENHPDAWYSDNPIMGDWYPVSPELLAERKSQLDSMYLLSVEQPIRTINNYLLEQNIERQKDALLFGMRIVESRKSWRDRRNSRTLK